VTLVKLVYINKIQFSVKPFQIFQVLTKSIKRINKSEILDLIAFYKMSQFVWKWG